MLSRKQLFLALSFLLLAAACSGPSKGARTTPAKETAAAPVDRANLEKQLTAFVEGHGRNWGEAYRYSGFVLVAQRGEVVYQRGFGFADRDRELGANADTSFRIGSVTKQFTAAAILLLEQQGKLSVSDPISKHIPEYPAVGASVTIHQLLTHTSGIPTYTGMPKLMAARAEPHTVKQLLTSFWDKPLEFEPGSKFSYSNSGYIVLGAIIERVSGLSYAVFVKRHLFAPAGMARTEIGDAPGADNRARGYVVRTSKVVPADPIDMSVPYAAGGVRSTANDLVKWHQALSKGEILSKASLEKMYTPEKDDYAYGWRVRDQHGHRVISHGGGIDGFSASYIFVVDADLVIAALCNNESVKSSRVADAAFAAAFGAEVEPVPESEVVETDPRVAARVVGKYRITDAGRKALLKAGAPKAALAMYSEVRIRDEGDHLLFEVTGQPPLDISQRGANMFFSKTHGFELEFALDKEGDAPARSMILRGMRKPIVFERVDEPG